MRCKRASKHTNDKQYIYIYIYICKEIKKNEI